MKHAGRLTIEHIQMEETPLYITTVNPDRTDMI